MHPWSWLTISNYFRKFGGRRDPSFHHTFLTQIVCRETMMKEYHGITVLHKLGKVTDEQLLTAAHIK